ncbi:MAG TPA: Ig-like domain-containing protein [Kofleriaceae bacterium]|nr:Ig-like domain-containing protein [Kofleriaceae bacterium]
MYKLWFLGLAVALTACSDRPYDPGAPAIDPSAPVVHITTPARGTFAGSARTLLVRGTASDDTKLASVEVNGVTAALDTSGGWEAYIPVGAGTQLIHAVARDAQGNTAKESRAVVIGPLRPIATGVPRAITAALSAQTFDALGRGVTGFLKTGDLAAIIAPHNPVIDVGGGPDCLFAQASITRMSVGSATTVAISPASGGLQLDVELDRVAIGMHLRYAVACFDGSRDVSLAASHIRVSGLLTVGINGGAFDIALASPVVKVTGFDADLGGVPGEIVDLLHIDSAIGSVIGWATGTFVVPLVNGALDELNARATVSVLGTLVDIAVSPAQIRIDSGGAVVELDSALRAHGDTGSPGYVYVANQVPPISSDSSNAGFALAIADDAANQLLGSFWAAGGLDMAFDLTTGSYGNIGQLYDRVELSAKVPPFIDASGGSLALTIGDLVATFKRGQTIATEVAVNAQIEVKVTTGTDGKPRLDVGAPTTYVDVLDENVEGSNPLSNAQFEAITSFALARVLAVGSGAVGAIPLPTFGGVAMRDVGIAEQAGYLVVDGNLQ